MRPDPASPLEGERARVRGGSGNPETTPHRQLRVGLSPGGGEADAVERVALIATVLNEAASLDDLLASVAAQTRPPDEVVIVDGGSTDGTWERLQAWAPRLPLHVMR